MRHFHLLSFILGTVQVASVNAQSVNVSGTGQATDHSSEMSEVVVTAKALDLSRDKIVPELGATKYSMDSTQIATQSQGDNAAFNQTLLRVQLKRMQK